MRLQDVRGIDAGSQGPLAMLAAATYVGKRGVYKVHTFGSGLARTSGGLVQIADVFWSSHCFQGLESGSSPTSGTVFPQVRGV